MDLSVQKIPVEKIGYRNFYPYVFVLKWVSLLKRVTECHKWQRISKDFWCTTEDYSSILLMMDTQEKLFVGSHERSIY